MAWLSKQHSGVLLGVINYHTGRLRSDVALSSGAEHQSGSNSQSRTEVARSCSWNGHDIHKGGRIAMVSEDLFTVRYFQ